MNPFVDTASANSRDRMRRHIRHGCAGGDLQNVSPCPYVIQDVFRLPPDLLPTGVLYDVDLHRYVGRDLNCAAGGFRIAHGCVHVAQAELRAPAPTPAGAPLVPSAMLLQSMLLPLMSGSAV